MALSFQPQCLHSHHAFLSHHIIKMKAFLPSSSNNHLLPVIASKGSVLAHRRFSSTSVFSRKKKKNRSGSRRFARLVLNLIPIIASNLKAPPRQLQLIAEELGGGDGSGGGPGWFWGGGSGWGWFDGWRRGGGRRKFGFWAILVACGLSLLLVGETESLAVCRILGLGLFGLALIGGWSKKKGTAVVKNGVLGICFLGAVSFLGLRKEEI
ncbi:uncharacterized protein LOC115686013 [Syzygium oleosum]|uniref:uncharacterized protein LOC115686013 n=1 Tax=Syzygium oleosum TaxID=219896 RepID=UPI0024BAD94B|nr:uncharacterized protein LOC115686013 [Syzygium oleosum]